MLNSAQIKEFSFNNLRKPFIIIHLRPEFDFELARNRVALMEGLETFRVHVVEGDSLIAIESTDADREEVHETAQMIADAIGFPLIKQRFLN